MVDVVNQGAWVTNTTVKSLPTFREVIVTDLHFFLGEANNRQGLHHNFPIILVTDRAKSRAVPLNKTNKCYNATDGEVA